MFPPRRRHYAVSEMIKPNTRWHLLAVRCTDPSRHSLYDIRRVGQRTDEKNKLQVDNWPILVASAPLVGILALLQMIIQHRISRRGHLTHAVPHPVTRHSPEGRAAGYVP